MQVRENESCVDLGHELTLCVTERTVPGRQSWRNAFTELASRITTCAYRLAIGNSGRGFLTSAKPLREDRRNACNLHCEKIDVTRLSLPLLERFPSAVSAREGVRETVQKYRRAYPVKQIEARV